MSLPEAGYLAPLSKMIATRWSAIQGHGHTHGVDEFPENWLNRHDSVTPR